MIIFGHSYECYVPDTQLIFPSIFLTNFDNLERRCLEYHKCYNFLDRNCDVKFLPALMDDVSNLLINSFRIFLMIIQQELLNSKRKKLKKGNFYKNVEGRFLYEDPGDFIHYWKEKKELFWSYQTLMYEIIKKRIIRHTFDATINFHSMSDGKNISYTETESKASDFIFSKLNQLQENKLLDSSANSSDLMILANCLVYLTTRLTHGILYLVTADNELHKATSEIIAKPHLLYPEYNEGQRIAGFRPLKPVDILKEIEKE